MSSPVLLYICHDVCVHHTGSFRRAEGANSKMLAGFKYEAEQFIAVSDTMYRTRTAAPPEVFSGKNSVNILHCGSVSVSLSDAYVVLCIWLFVPEMSFLKTICFGIS